MKAPAIGTVLLTLGVLVYLLLTEWTFWKKYLDDKPKAAETSTGSAAARAERTAARRAAATQERSDSQATGSSAQTTAEPTVATQEPRRTGRTIYRIDQPCDCSRGQEIMLETVEVNDQATILTLLNASRAQISTHPPGHASAQYLTEWRYVDNNKPRHDLSAILGIPPYPERADPTRFQLVFPRIADAATKIQLTGHRTRDLDYFMFSTIELNDPISIEEWERMEGYRTCGFDGPELLEQGTPRAYVAHRHPDMGGFSWSVNGSAVIAGSASGSTVSVRGQGAGTAELCLSTQRAGASCRSCQTIEVSGSAQAQELDFAMTSCGGVPSRPPHWRFAVQNPPDGATFQWNVKPSAILLEGSQTNPLLMMRPSPRPGFFTVSLRARQSSGQETTVSRKFHSVYSCPVTGAL